MDAKTVGPGGEVPPRARWLVLIYRVPSEPTRLRASVWRRLKSLGAVYLQNSAAVLPAAVGSDRALRALRNEIVEEMGGMAILLMSEALVGEAEIAQALNRARDEEYDEIVQRCEEFLHAIGNQIKAKHFTYAAMEEHDDGLKRLRRSMEKVRARDALDATGAARADEMLGECAQAMNDFAERVYQFDSATDASVQSTGSR
jgi:hypothetical protein